VLGKGMDKLVWQFRDSAPEFAKEYESARLVVDIRGPLKEVTATPALAPTPQPA